MMKKIRLFHFFEPQYKQILGQIERSGRRQVIQQSLTVYEGIGRYAIVSGDDEVHRILRAAGCHELSQDGTMIQAIANEPEVFRFCYGNQALCLQ